MAEYIDDVDRERDYKKVAKTLHNEGWKFQYEYDDVDLMDDEKQLPGMYGSYSRADRTIRFDAQPALAHELSHYVTEIEAGHMAEALASVLTSARSWSKNPIVDRRSIQGTLDWWEVPPRRKKLLLKTAGDLLVSRRLITRAEANRAVAFLSKEKDE